MHSPLAEPTGPALDALWEQMDHSVRPLPHLAASASLACREPGLSAGRVCLADVWIGQSCWLCKYTDMLAVQVH